MLKPVKFVVIVQKDLIISYEQFILLKGVTAGKKKNAIWYAEYKVECVFQISSKMAAQVASYDYFLRIVFTTIHHFWDFRVQWGGSGAAGRARWIYAVRCSSSMCAL